MYKLLLLLLIVSLNLSAQPGFRWINNHGDLFVNHPEQVRDIHVDDQGNVYVAGQMNPIFVRDSNGVVIKRTQYPGFILDSISNQGGRDVWLAKYDSQGQLQWHRYAGGGNDDSYYDMIGDANGNTYVAGRVVGTGSPFLPEQSFGKTNLRADELGNFIAKIDPNGNLLWHRHFGGDTIGNTYYPFSSTELFIALENNEIKVVFRGGGQIGSIGYQLFFDRDSLAPGIHDARFDLNGNYLGVRSFPFPRFDGLAYIHNLERNENGVYLSGWLDRDSVFVASDTIVRIPSQQNAYLMAFDTSLNYQYTFYSRNYTDHFFDAKLSGDSLITAATFDGRVTTTFDTISHTSQSNEFRLGGLFVFDAPSGRLKGLYPSRSNGPITSVFASATAFSNHFIAIGGSFNEEVTFSSGNNYMKAVSNDPLCNNRDAFFSVLNRNNGAMIEESVIYSSACATDAVLCMYLRDSMVYIGGAIGDSVIISGVDTLITRAEMDAFVAAYYIGTSTNINEGPSNYIKADNGLLAYPNPTEGRLFLMGEPLAEEALLYSINGRLVKRFRLQKQQFRQYIDISEVDSGIYFLVVQGAKNRQTVKIVKQ